MYLYKQVSKNTVLVTYRDYKQAVQEYKVKGRLITVCGACAIIQQGKNKFAVGYGAECDGGMPYEMAAKCFGLAVFHDLQCEGRIDE